MPSGGQSEIVRPQRAKVVPSMTMRRSPGSNDFDGWVAQLGVSSLRPRAKQYLVTAGPPAVPAIRRGLRHGKPIVRRLCVNLLDRFVDDESVSDLIRAVRDDVPEVSARALHALACDRCKQNACRPGDDLWVPQAVDFVQTNNNPDLRAAAIAALGTVVSRRPDVAAVLRNAAHTDPDRRLQSMARRYAR
jgi:HEAT repeat protein